MPGLGLTREQSQSGSTRLQTSLLLVVRRRNSLYSKQALNRKVSIDFFLGFGREESRLYEINATIFVSNEGF